MTERYFHANAEALKNAVGALPAVALPAAPSALEGVKSAYSALSADEREAFKRWLAEQG